MPRRKQTSALNTTSGAKVASQALPQTLCNDVATMTRAVTALRSCSYIVCDCEGTNLGSQGGSLSLIILLGIPTDNQGPHVYLIDAITLGNSNMQPVFSLLRSEEYTKLMYDARMDWSELFHRHNVRLARVLDLQLADIQSRRRRGETENQQLARLSPFCGEADVKSHRSSYAKIHRLNSLESCAVEHGVVGANEKVKIHNFPHHLWKNRPLPKKHLQYATMDAYLIYRIYAEFIYMGYINYIKEANLLEQSARYMTLHRRVPKPMNTGHPPLPLDIIVAPTAREKLFCATCSRSLSLQCFPEPARGMGGDRNCFVCRAVNLNKAERAAKKVTGKQPVTSQKPQAGGQPAAGISSGRFGRRPGESSVRQPRFHNGVAFHGRPQNHSYGTLTYPDSDGKYGIFGYDEEDVPGGTYYRDMYDSD